MTPNRFHGRVSGSQRVCTYTGCTDPGEFRAPNPYGTAASADGPGDWLWFCLDHVREFNARYDFFTGMSREEIEEAQRPAAGWATETRAFAHAGVDAPPRWTDFSDPLEAISGRFRSTRAERSSRLPAEELRALKILGLNEDATRAQIRARYSELVRKYHPDRNGGDRSFEKKLQAVVEAHQLLRSSALLPDKS